MAYKISRPADTLTVNVFTLAIPSEVKIWTTQRAALLIFGAGGFAASVTLAYAGTRWCLIYLINGVHATLWFSSISILNGCRTSQEYRGDSASTPGAGPNMPVAVGVFIEPVY
ncbi:hypothetical protein MPER_07565 [Moniliophthora perniciosa FA553]|nr:hypothetical protein MPER_07565 [Moniliophthora perniciosa FA553]